MGKRKEISPSQLDAFFNMLLDKLEKGGYLAPTLTCPNCESEMQKDEDTQMYCCEECGYSEKRD